MHRHFSNTWEVDQGQVDDIWRVDRQIDRFVGNTFAVRPSNPVSLLNDLLSNLIKIGHFYAFPVCELSPLFVILLCVSQ